MRRSSFALASSSLLTVLAASMALGTPPGPTTSPQESPTTAVETAEAVAPLLRKVRFIGASVTAGYGTAAEGGIRRNLPLELFVEGALSEKNQGADLDTKGSNTFFQAPTLTGKQQVAWAVQDEPSLVVALDFLFWYGFGIDSSTEPRRMVGLEKGLKALEAIQCPLLLGTLPNVDHSMDGDGPFGRPILSPFQIAPEKARVKMNARIVEWAAERDNVHLIDSEGNLASMVAGDELVVGEERWKPKSMGDVLQKDLLHLRVDGYVWTALTLADAMTKLDGASPEDFRMSQKAIRGAFDDHVKKTLEKRAERRKR